MSIYPKAFLRSHLNAVNDALKDLDSSAILECAQKLRRVQGYGHIVYLCGNGGSAATASHFANDLLKMADVEAICLNDMTSTMLAYMNDDGIEEMFAKPFGKFKVPGDVLVAISCSGNSRNIVGIMETAAILATTIILLTGDKGGKAAEIADVVIKVPHPDIKVQEDVHLAICHALAGVLAEEWE